MKIQETTGFVNVRSLWRLRPEGLPLRKMNAVIFYDGECGLCGSSIDLVMKHDVDDRFRFASLSSDYAKSFFESRGIEFREIDSVIVFIDGEVKTHSDAILAISATLGFPYNIVRLTSLIPRSIRDSVYSFVARNRKSLFSDKDHCEEIPKECVWKFLDRGESKA